MSADLMRRLVKCPGWTFTPGLQAEEADNGCRSTLAFLDAAGRWNAVTPDGAWMRFERSKGLLPVATDPLLPGWVLRLVREATDDPGAHVVLCEGRWLVVNGKMHAQVFRMCDTEIEALVLALEAAPVKS